MTISEYKEKFLELYKALESEHGYVKSLKLERVENPYFVMESINGDRFPAERCKVAVMIEF